MIHLRADETPLSILSSLVEPVVLYDASGSRVIGHFTPVDVERGKRLYADLAARTDTEELARRKASTAPPRPFGDAVKSLGAGKPAVAADAELPADTPAPSGRDGCATP